MSEINRRKFLQTAAATGAGLSLAGNSLSQGQETGTNETKPDDINIALIGFGNQMRFSLFPGCLKIPGVRIAAICDIWDYHRGIGVKYLKKYKQTANEYTDYREMLEKEKGLDAAIIATPDIWHAPQTIDCLKAGLHVYCEKEMSNTLEEARNMVLASQETGRLLQIGHQRRSNPRYLHALNMIEKEKMLGRITNFNGQWNRAVQDDRVWAKGKDIDAATLKKYGYESMHEFYNWRWYKKYSGGPISDLGSHQIDVFSWFLKANPKSVVASAGVDYYEGRDWYDNVMTIYEYDGPDGPVRGSYQVIYTSSHGGFFETFMGDDGSMVISEDSRKGFLFREFRAKTKDWEEKSEKTEQDGEQVITLQVGKSLSPDGVKTPEAEKMEAEVAKPVHQLHLENFFNAIRNGTRLSCPGEIGYETAVAVLRVNEALEQGKRIEFSPEEFKV